MADRPHVAGSVHPRGSRFVAQLPRTLGRRAKLFDTEDAAWEWLTIEQAKKTLGLLDATEVQRLTVSELVDVWLASHQSLKPTTRIDYTIRIDKHIKAHPIGKLPVDMIRGMHVDKCLSDCPPNWTRIHVAKILSAFFDWAEANQFVVGNPYRQSQAKRMCQIVYRAHERKDSTDNVWTPEQLVTFIEHESCPVFRCYWIFVAATGARRGEAIGLTWDNTFPEAGWAWLADNITTAGNEIIEDETPKTHKRRKAYFGPVVGQLLVAHKAEQDAYKAQFPEWRGNWVFDRRRGKGKRFYPGVYLAPATVTQRFNRQAADLGLPPLAGPHGLRRTFATIAEREEFRPSVRTAAMGHTPDITGRYTKASEADMQALAARLAGLIVP